MGGESVMGTFLTTGVKMGIGYRSLCFLFYSLVFLLVCVSCYIPGAGHLADNVC
jgi:hypothetical protein